MTRPAQKLTDHAALDRIDGLIANWDFEMSASPWKVKLWRLRSIPLGLRPAPAAAILKPVTPVERWNCYFLFLPTGTLSAAQRFSLARLRELEGELLVICAAPTPSNVPDELHALSTALIWKGLSGYDFSAYSIALHEIAERSPGADVFVMNDSVLGPFDGLEAMLENAPWELTGFTASSAMENHLQSYAFQMRSVTPERVRALRTVMPQHTAYNHFHAVVSMQETRFARVAAQTMKVGAFWFADADRLGDPSLFAGPALLEAGLPFLKRSLLDRYGSIHDQERLRALLSARGHPVE